MTRMIGADAEETTQMPVVSFKAVAFSSSSHACQTSFRQQKANKKQEEWRQEQNERMAT